LRLPYVQLKTTQGCLRENTLSILVFSAAGQSSCGSTGGRIEARRHERWRVKGSQAGRMVQGGKRDVSIISQNRTIHELSCTLYRRHREVSDVTHTVPGPNTAEQPYPRCTRLLGWQRIERKLAYSPARTYGTWFCAVAVGRRPTARLAPPLPSLLGGIVLPTIPSPSLDRRRRKGIGRSPNVRLPDDLDISSRTGILRVDRHRRWIANRNRRRPLVRSGKQQQLASSVLWRLRTFVVRCVAHGALVTTVLTVLTVLYCNTTCVSCHI